jgi:tRNA dimethylallyltransferase
MPKNKHLIVIAGPTAVGKTSVAIKLAQEFQSEIISADSRQFFKELEIGTAKPTDGELATVKHHFINNLSIHESCDAGKFAMEAEKLIDQLFESQDVIIMVGGSGLYIKALCDGLDEMPDIPSNIRQTLNEEYESEGLENLLAELNEADPIFFNLVDKKNPQRVIRALEIIRGTGMSYSSFRNAKSNPIQKNYKTLKIGLEMEREILYDRINDRMDEMITNGLFEEAEKYYELKNLPALQTVGYSEIFQYLDGAYDKEEAIRLLKRNSRRYAKRQLTWFKKDEAFEWYSPNDFDSIKKHIDSKVNQLD